VSERRAAGGAATAVSSRPAALRWDAVAWVGRPTLKSLGHYEESCRNHTLYERVVMDTSIDWRQPAMPPIQPPPIRHVLASLDADETLCGPSDSSPGRGRSVLRASWLRGGPGVHIGGLANRFVCLRAGKVSVYAMYR
jgi:hypothetical protein